VLGDGEDGLQAPEGRYLGEDGKNLRRDAVGVLPAVGEGPGGVACPPLLVGFGQEALPVLGGGGGYEYSCHGMSSPDKQASIRGR